MNIKKLSVLSMLMVALFAFTAKAQEADADKFSFGASFNQDIFFGFYPTVSGSYQISESISVGMYGIFWTTPSFSPAGNGGGLWTEWGPAVTIESGPLSITPALGILNGALLSNGFGAQAKAFEGIVPNVTVDLASDNIEGQVYFGYYASTGGANVFDGVNSFNEVGTTNNYIHYWIKGGYAVDPRLSLGAGWEHLYSMPGDAAGTAPDPSDLYMWVGPYVSFNHPGGHSLSFQAGADVYDADGPADDEQTTFYKMSASFAF